MFVKKFEASSMENALALVKEELGAEALILSTEKKKQGWRQKPVVCVTAASEKKKENVSAKRKTLSEIFPHRRDIKKKEVASKPKVEEKNTLYNRKGKREAINPTKVPNDHFSRLEKSLTKVGLTTETSRELTRQLVFDYSKEDLSVPSFLAKAKMTLLSQGIKELPFESFCQTGGWVAVGAAGSGKTSTVVRIAMDLQRRGKEVCLVGLDKRKVLGANELAAYAKLIGLPFSTQITDTGEGETVQLIDGPSLPFEHAREGERAAQALKGKSVLLVLDATRRAEEMMRTVDQARAFFPRAICFTRLDEAVRLGVAYEILRRSKIPLLGASLSRSFKIPYQFLSKRAFLGQLFEERGEL